MKKQYLLILFVMMIVFTACSDSKQQTGNELKSIRVVLDWTANTNHTGLYVAQSEKYYEEEGLKVEILQPGSGGAEAMVATGGADFGVSYQETVTLSRLQDVPIVSIAAVIQHNTSGFAAPADRQIQSPVDFEGMTYAGYGSDTEKALLQSVMQSVNGDVEQVKMISSGTGDFFTSVQRDVDFALIYYGWTGIEAELREEPVDIFYLKDYAPELDFYTPVLITNEALVDEEPDLIRSFLRATTKGYEYAIEQPENAAQILLAAAPELDEELVIASQQWLASKYQDDAERWGEQKLEVWENYASWMFENKLLESELDAQSAFTNDFLP